MTILEQLQATHPEAEGISDARNIAEAVACINNKGGRGANAIAGKLEDIIHSDNIAAKIAAKNDATDARNIAEALSGRRGANAIAEQISEDEEERVTLTELTYSGTLAFEQYEGIPFDPRGLTFTAHFSDGTTATVDPADLVMPTELLLETTGVTPAYTYNGVTKRTTSIPITVKHTVLTAGNYRFVVRNSFSEMLCISGTAISMATNSSAGITTPQPDLIKYSEDSRGRRRVACAIAAGQTHPAINGEILAVRGGSTIRLAGKPSGFTHPVAWSMMELDSNLAYVGGDGIRAEQWLEGERTLQANTAYIQVSFKPKNDTASTPVYFTAAEYPQLPSAALAVYEPDDLFVYWDANGGVGGVGPVVHHVDNGGYNITMLDSDIGDSIYHPEGKTIVGWSTTPDASSGSYLPSQTTRYVPSGNQTLPLTITFYAIWQ